MAQLYEKCIKNGLRMTLPRKIILEVINTIFQLKKFKKFKLSNFFIEAQREDPIMSDISSVSDARLLWGGDKAINA